MTAMNEMRAFDGRTVLLACEDSRFSRMISLELERLGLRTADYRPDGDVGRIVLIDIDDAPELCDLLPESCLKIGWTRRERAFDGYGDEKYFAVLHRPFLTAELLSRVADAMSVMGMISSGDGEALQDNAPVYAPVSQLMYSASYSPSAILLSNGEGERVVNVRGVGVKLSPREWSIYTYLASRKGQLVSREELAELIGCKNGSNTVDVYVCHLRDKLERPVGVKIIASVRGKGYIFK